MWWDGRVIKVMTGGLGTAIRHVVPCRVTSRLAVSRAIARGVRVLAALLCLAAPPAMAQAPPSLVIDAPPELAAARARLDSFDLAPLSGIASLVGLDAPGPPIHVILAGDDSDIAREVSPDIAGFAIGDQGLVVLFPSRSPAYPHDTLEDVLRHEVAHVLISRAAGGRPVPRWFHEGFAVVVERPWGLEDRSRLAVELMFGPRLTLAQIDALFAGNHSAQARAYSLSAAVTRDLMTSYGQTAPASILRRLKNGDSFDQAVAGVAGRSVALIETEFWDHQRTWTLWIPLATSGSVLWLGVMALAALAVRRRRQRSAEIRREWAASEAPPAEPPSETIH